MQTYIGTKIIMAMPMMLGNYNTYQGWDIPKDQDPLAEGYLVEYLDGGEPNHSEHKGYISWSPSEVFDNTYKDVSVGMTFGGAVEMLKNGCKVARKGWNGKGMFLFLVDGSNFKVNRAPLLGIYPEGTEIDYRPHIDMRTVNGEIVPWVASQSDMLEDDWIVID